MNAGDDHIAELIKKHLLEQLSESESIRLKDWIEETDRNRQTLDYICSKDFFREAELIYDEFNNEAVINNIQAEFSFENDAPIVHRVHFLKTASFRWAAAIIILFGIGTYIFSHTSRPDKEMAIDQPSPKSSDVAPGYNRAVLTLSDGRKIAIDSAAAETITDGALTITNIDGGLSYKNAEVVAVNTMSTPKGGQYQLTLADGTKVWLNAASSITFPTAFKGNTREVSVIGEAYFEVTRNKEKPFIVKTKEEQITVLGTSFNVNRYEDEPAGKISLIEGSILVGALIVKPGQAYQDGKIWSTKIDQDIAWKNGFFNFNKASVAEAARQIARWYDIKIEFVGEEPNEKLFGEVDRSISLQDLLKGYEGEIAHFELKGKTLFIKSL